MAKFGFYAVARGHVVGIFTDWTEAEKQVKGFGGAKHKKFRERHEAEAYLSETNGWENDVGLPPVRASRLAVNSESGEIKLEPETANRSNAPSTGDSDEMSRSFSGPTVEPTSPSRLHHTKIPPEFEGKILTVCKGVAEDNGTKLCRGTWSVVFPSHPDVKAIDLVKGEATNNRADYTAALAALKLANEIDPNGEQRLVIFMQLELLVNTMNKWMKRWQRNDWKRSSGDEVKNRDLLEEILRVRGDRLVEWRHVKKDDATSWTQCWFDQAKTEAQTF